MSEEEKNNINGGDPKPKDGNQPSTQQNDDSKIDRNYSDIGKANNADWSRNWDNGYRPTEDSTNPQPPSDSGKSEDD